MHANNAVLTLILETFNLKLILSIIRIYINSKYNIQNIKNHYITMSSFNKKPWILKLIQLKLSTQIIHCLIKFNKNNKL